MRRVWLPLPGRLWSERHQSYLAHNPEIDRVAHDRTQRELRIFCLVLGGRTVFPIGTVLVL